MLSFGSLVPGIEKLVGNLIRAKGSIVDSLKDAFVGFVKESLDIDKEVEAIQTRIDNSPFKGILVASGQGEQVWFPAEITLTIVGSHLRYCNRAKAYATIHDEILDMYYAAKTRLEENHVAGAYRSYND